MTGLYADPAHAIAYDGGEVRWVEPTGLNALTIHPSMRLRIKHGLEVGRVQPYLG